MWLRQQVTITPSGVLEAYNCTTVFRNRVSAFHNILVKMQMEIGCGCESPMEFLDHLIIPHDVGHSE
jgi:hypothetical protein